MSDLVLDPPEGLGLSQCFVYDKVLSKYKLTVNNSEIQVNK